MKRVALLLPLFFAAAVAGAEPTLLNEAACYEGLQSAALGSVDFDGGKEVLRTLFETQLKPQPELLKTQVPIGYRDSSKDFIRYAQFWFQHRVELEKGLDDGATSKKFYLVDQYGVWEGEFPQAYTVNRQALPDYEGTVKAVHPMTRQEIAVNYTQGTAAANAEGVQVKFGTFEGKQYPKVKLSLITGEKADRYVSETLAKLIKKRIDESMSGIGHPDLKKAVSKVIIKCMKIDRPVVKEAVKLASRAILYDIELRARQKRANSH